MKLEFPRADPGDEITTLHFKALYAALEQLKINIPGGGGLIITETPKGYAMASDCREGFWAKLTINSSNDYAWIEQIPQSGGAWVDGYSTGTTSTDPAHELNGNTSIPSLPIIVWAWRSATSGEVLFQQGLC